MINALVTAQP